jgi:VWFA-related protein
MIWIPAALAVATAVVGLQAQSAPPAQPPAQQQQQPPPARPDQRDVIRRSFDIITTDVIVRDNSGAFMPDIKKGEFEVYEDGVKQDVISFVLTHGGRIYNQDTPPPPPPQEGIILPPSRPSNDAAGRIFLIFVDDLHLDFRNTGRIRDLFNRISKELIHEGDMFGIVSTGPSSLAIELTYDHKRLDQAIKKIAGNGLRPQEILEGGEGQEGPPEIRYRAHVAFSTAYEMMKNLEQVHNRRKAFIYVSNGYDFDPFAETRAKNRAEQYRSMTGASNSGEGGDQAIPEEDPFAKQGNLFASADLASQLSELTRAANRANTTIYTIDPRGLVGGPDLDEKIDMVEWQNYIKTSQDSLRVIADLTGGIAIVNQNDFTKALKRIDNETSDYYVLGYVSTNPDPTQKRRKIEVKVQRPGANVWSRTEYTLKRPLSPPKTK